MKHGRRPTYKQKLLMAKNRLNYKDWLVVSDTAERMVLEHRHVFDTVKVIYK